MDSNFYESYKIIKFISKIYKIYSFPLEMHMVHVNSKYVDKDGKLDGDFLKSADGLAVLGFMFELNSKVWKYN